MKLEHKNYCLLFTSYFLHMVLCLLFSYLVLLLGEENGWWRWGLLSNMDIDDRENKIDVDDSCRPIEDQIKMEPFPAFLLTKLGVKSFWGKGKHTKCIIEIMLKLTWVHPG